MSYADDVFIKMCQDILENGTSTEGEKVRPVWEDGTPAVSYTHLDVYKRQMHDYEPDREDGLCSIRKMLKEAKGIGDFLGEMGVPYSDGGDQYGKNYQGDTGRLV